MYFYCNLYNFFVSIVNLYSDIFKSIDKNGDGSIDFDEFIFATAVLNLNGDLDDRLNFIFDL